MAKSTKSKTAKSKIDETSIDAIEVTDPIADDVIVADHEMDTVDDEPTETVDEPTAEISSALPITEDGNSSTGFVPLLLGGLVAGAIGYAIATFYPLSTGSDELSAQMAAQADQIAALETQLANTPAPDFAPIEGRIESLEGQTTSNLDDLTADIGEQIAALDARILEVEKAPAADGTLSDTALAAYQRELDDLRAELTAQQETVMSAAAQAEADLAEARAEAELLEQEAIATAQAAAARAALNRVATAVETGAPYGDALNDIGAADLPVALTNAAESGVATTAQLIADYPASARAALATARAEGVSDDAGGIGGFLRSQFDVRSTAPQEGPGPDAVLSRAEAAIKEGRVADALAEIEALPEVARAEMTDWTARATQRADVLDAIATLSETYN